jgi:hypothetical protein
MKVRERYMEERERERLEEERKRQEREEKRIKSLSVDEIIKEGGSEKGQTLKKQLLEFEKSKEERFA